MDEFWVGKQGTLEEDERTALQDSGVDVEDLRRMTASTGFARDWWTLRTFVLVPAADEFAAENARRAGAGTRRRRPGRVLGGHLPLMACVAVCRPVRQPQTL
jgi:hypothetical protein